MNRNCCPMMQKAYEQGQVETRIVQTVEQLPAGRQVRLTAYPALVSKKKQAVLLFSFCPFCGASQATPGEGERPDSTAKPEADHA